MRWKEYINAEEVSKAIKVLQGDGNIFEVRAIGTSKKDILSGYFRDADTLLNAFDSIDMRKRNAYITLGQVNEDCFARSQSEHFDKSMQTTSDNDIIAYRWLFVDLDPVRTVGISSSDEELQFAFDMADKVAAYLAQIGFCEPVRAMSGNGIHLLYRISLPNTKENVGIIERCLKVLADMFSNDQVKIDTTNSNPSRICKLHGTMAQKGRSTQKRPHRMSRILSVPDEIQQTQEEILRRLAAELPSDEAKPDRRPGGGLQQQTFDLRSFMLSHGLTVCRERSNDRADIYELDECPFNSSHRDGDAKIFSYHNGAIAFKCHHDSCRQYKWQDVRLKFEPDAYDQKDDLDDERIDRGYLEHLKRKEAEEAQHPPEAQKSAGDKKKHKIRKLKTAEALMEKDLPEPKVLIGVGNELPLLVEGTCILSAKPKLGKSWLALSMCIAVAKGEDFLGYQTNQCSTLYLDLETSEQLQQKRLRKVLQGETVPRNFYLETETDSLENGFIEQIEAYLEEDPNIGIVVIDVFQIIRSPAKSMKESEYEHAYRDITPLNELAQKHHISIILVCHDRKAVDPDDPFSNILGSTGLQGAATQMMVMFRKRKDDPIHISVKGKTIDGLPELNVKLDHAKWSIVEGVNSADREQAERLEEYRNSDIRRSVVKIMDGHTSWRGRCGDLIQLSVKANCPIVESAKTVGGFLCKHMALFSAEDGLIVERIFNGTGGSTYKIYHSTVDTVDEDEDLPLPIPQEWLR
jgi:hypothetical protein